MRVASALSTVGIASSFLPKSAAAQTSTAANPPARTSAAQEAGEIRKLNGEGQPAAGNEIIMPVIVHNGLIYVSGQGAHDKRDRKEWTIESHTSMVMDKIKKLVEVGGGTADSILLLQVFLTNIDHWDGMHKVFSTYFPHGGPARTTVAVAALPGDSLVEINCIAAVTHK
jgi:2-iminobutanoate/2-iminopropanoate deaminase